MKPRDLAFLVLINLIWGLNVVPMKWAVEQASPIALTFARFLVVLVVCLPFLKWQEGKMRSLLVVGLVAGALQFTLNFVAFGLADDVSSLAIAGQLGVPFSLILAIVFLGERIKLIRTFGILLSFAGVVVLVFDPHAFDERLALGIACLGAFTYAMGTILMRQLSGVHPLSLQAWMALISIGPVAACSALFEPGGFQQLVTMPTWVWGCIAFSALAASIIGHSGLYYLLQRYPVSVITPVTLLSPLIAVIASIAILGDSLTAQMILGGVMTLAGVAIITLRTAQKQSGA
jgi:O-acetylserine/cysteine efflux transporter